MKHLISIIALFAAVAGDAHGAAPKVFFVTPKDGAEVPGKLHVKFGQSGIRVRPAGEDVNETTSGHHHIIIDGKPVPAGQVVPADENHIHYGKGQTEADLDLKPGKHTLTLQFADGAHRSYGVKLSSTITITVK